MKNFSLIIKYKLIIIDPIPQNIINRNTISSLLISQSLPIGFFVPNLFFARCSVLLESLTRYDATNDQR
uniref:Uncharacterized protein n=1 Tax=Siphoviridae sp. ctKgQ2 TaxID=2827842 RepID=A0A8S5TMD1_9CAUD|nr:MAG TPA: hypothetical protein [Siphoviridae sp. ctKgQ2]